MSGISSYADAFTSGLQSTSSAAATQQTAESTQTDSTKRVTKGLGKTVGDVSLSEEGAAYYKKLKEKFGNMNFVLVSADMKEQVKANAGSYASQNGTTVLIDVDKIEKMATDKEFRAQYEGIISQASANLSQLSAGLSQSGNANGVVGYGATINDNGTASYFAVVDKSLAAQSERIAEKRAEKKEEAKKEAKAEAKKEEQERILDRIEARRSDEKHRAGKADAPAAGRPEDQITITADSIDELLYKIGNTVQDIKMNSVRTPAEQALGGHIDFRG